ncbi:outer membrane efflux protein [Chthoniobacter flavus Ellin428]|uniref:Outer membrane efflux protein n=1 Tax=Chthoniobacter flavus Ellin428 TaxID=497964 RepID=B4CUM0_9BACT|nr:TolC family protein [Chthoniobacter flavus]EDY22258.1 outer membrane efflux protein [Chthoniobacter flavus Ellin428]TCO94723.1 outer membrane protein [Chthoniobacter flavus]
MKRFFFVFFGITCCAIAATPKARPLPAPAAPEKHPAPVDQLDLTQAETIALQQSPTVYAAQYQALAAQQVVRQVKSAFYPQITAEFSAVTTGDDFAGFFGLHPITNQDTRIAASGGLNNPTILSRQANGILFNQLITDFGRTWNLTAASKNMALSAVQKSTLARAKVMLLVDRAYFQAQQAQALLRVADETVMARQLLADQVGALAKSQLKSELDVSFARVSLDEAKLLRLEAQNQVNAAFADLSYALGYHETHRFALVPIPQFAMPKGNLAGYITQALAMRPEALSLRHERDAAKQTATAERAAHLPKVSLIGAAGRGTAGDPRVEGDYAAAGVNVELPLFTGFRLSARDKEASLQAQTADQNLQEIEDLIAKDVEVALLNTTNSADKIDVTASLLANAEQAYNLAEAKYNIGMTSIVEFSQAQLAKLQAQINHTTATYEYQINRLVLDFQTGAPKYLQSPVPQVVPRR